MCQRSHPLLHTFRSLEHRNYRLYFIGQGISLIGSWMQTTALIWLAYDLTHQARWPAFIMVAMIGPTLFLAPWAGSLADRIPKHKLILRTQVGFLLSATILTILVALGWINVWILLAMMLCHGVVQAIDLPARLAFVPELVPREYLINTVALNSAQFNTARAVGPAIAGLAMIHFGPALCFLINAVSYLAVLAALLAMRDIPEHVHPEPGNRGGGFAVLRRDPQLMLLILLAGLASVAGWPLLSLLPAYAERVLHEKESAYSAMLSSVGIGALLAALTVATFSTENRQKAILIVGVGCVGSALQGLCQVEMLTPAMLYCGLFGFGMILFFATGQAVVQLGVTRANRGKVMGVWAMMLGGGAPVGNLIFGPAADEWGVTTVIFFQGLLMIVVLALMMLRSSTPTTENNHD